MIPMRLRHRSSYRKHHRGKLKPFVRLLRQWNGEPAPAVVEAGLNVNATEASAAEVSVNDDWQAERCIRP